eukprot:g448.t1
MRDKGIVRLDDPVSSLLHNFRISPPPAARSRREITLKALAMQVSGLPREIPHYVPGATREETERRVLESIATNLTQMSSMYASPHYSNLGLALLGRALEKASNRTWEDYLRTEILEPLGMHDTGNPADFIRDPQVRARVIDGVAVPNGSSPVHVSETNTWGGPCGAMHSSFRDMTVWMNFLMDVASSEAEQDRYARVLDPATRAEMRNTGYVMGDGLSAVSSGVLERAFVDGRWTDNKLGCVDGYRSDMTLIPSLGLAMFGVATSTCDMYGDGDAVVFPVMHRLVDAVENALQEAPPRPLPSAHIIENVVGSYCDGTYVVRVENNTHVVARGDPYSFVLQFLNATKDARVSTWRMVMGPESWLPQTTMGCAAPDAYPHSHGLCPISCWRKMARGSGAIAHFRRDPETGAIAMDVPGSGEYCTRD